MKLPSSKAEAEAVVSMGGVRTEKKFARSEKRNLQRQRGFGGVVRSFSSTLADETTTKRSKISCCYQFVGLQASCVKSCIE